MHGFGTCDRERTVTAIRLLLAHLRWNIKRLLGVMVLDGMEVEADELERPFLRQGDTHL